MKWRYRFRRKPMLDDVSNRAKVIRSAHKDGRVNNLYAWCKFENDNRPSDDPWEVDHIRPMARGGLHEYDNLRIIRRSANKLWNSVDRTDIEIDVALRLMHHARTDLS